MKANIDQYQIRVVLVEPSHPGNIGAAARAMKTMGLTELYLVNPSRFPDPQADWRAANALDIIEQAHVARSLAEAIDDCQYVAGTSARDRHVPWPVLSPEEFSVKVVSEMGTRQRIAIVFGRENNGLTNEELTRCHCHVRIPSNPVSTSLNLAMSVQIVTYELFKATMAEVEESAWDRVLATSGDVERLYEHFESVLDQIDFFGPDSPRHAMVRFQRLFARVALDETEVGLMHGFLKRIEKSTR